MMGAFANPMDPLVKGKTYTFRFDLPATTIVFPQSKIQEALAKLVESGAMKKVNAVAKPGGVYGDAGNGDWNLEFLWNGAPGPVIKGWGDTLAQLFSEKLPWYDGSLVGAKIRFFGGWEGTRADAPDLKASILDQGIAALKKAGWYLAGGAAAALLIFGFAKGAGKGVVS